MNWTLLLLFIVQVLGGVCALSLVWIWTVRRDLAALQGFAEKMLKAQEKERKRIAGELHSNIGQNLLIIKNRAELGLNPATDATAARQQLQEISKICSATIAESRVLAHNLGPRHLEQIGLTEALDAMVDGVAASTSVHFERKLESVDEVFEPEAAVSLYRIAQEALNNLMKHAQASLARVNLVRDLHQVQLIVQDNGCGFETKANGQPVAGFGLAEMTERARILKGRMELVSQPGAGTRLTVTIPIRDGERIGGQGASHELRIR